MRLARRGEDGIAMISALGVTLVVTLLTVAAVQTQIHSLNATSVDRARVQGDAVAQAGLDTTYQALSTVTASTALPCGAQSPVTLQSGPTTSTYTVTTTYYDTYPPVDNPLTCTQVSSGSSIPLAAQIKVTGSGNVTANSGNRVMQALVHLTAAQSGSTFDKAIFSDASMMGSNNPTVYQYVSNDADIYSNASISCGNNFDAQGRVIAQGGFTGTNNCTVTGDVYVKTGANMTNNTTIGGNVKVSAGNITMSNNVLVSKSAYASGSISLSNNAVVSGSQVPNDAGLAPPPAEAFPQLTFSASSWTSQGYTLITDNDCNSSDSTNVYKDVQNMATATNPTVIHTSCALSWSNNTSLPLKQNLAIFSSGGYSMSNNTTWSSADGLTHKLYLVVPFDAATMPCTSPGISLSNNTAFSSQLNILWYTPCTMTVSNNSTGYGQLYAGTVNASNNFTMHYVPMGNVPGSGGGAAPAFTVGIEYERETT